MANSYENIIKNFEKNNCKLLTTKEEHVEIVKISKSSNYKLKYIASCGHEHNVFYNVFKSRNTGIVCSSCKNKQIGKNTKDKIMNNELSKIDRLEQEFDFIVKIKYFLQNDFDIVKAFDGCKVDMIFRPKNINEDKWVGIQVKTTKERRLTYSFHIHKNYDNCLLLLYCVDDESAWLVPENIIGNQKKISIGYNKSKYNIYKVCKENIIENLHELYNVTSKYGFDLLNLPINIYQQREQEYRKYREEKIPFIPFIYHEMEGTVYDFKIGNFKIQEKVSTFDNNNRCHFCIYKSDGGEKNKFKPYDIGDNDFYWLNCTNKKTFFVIPEKVFINRGMVGGTNKKILKVTIQTPLHERSSWLNDFMFDYDNLDEERLKKLFTL
jgi:hypothetical protein